MDKISILLQNKGLAEMLYIVQILYGLSSVKTDDNTVVKIDNNSVVCLRWQLKLIVIFFLVRIPIEYQVSLHNVKLMSFVGMACSSLS